MLETLGYTIRIGSTPTFLYFDLYLHSAYAVHYVYNTYWPFASPKHENFKFQLFKTWHLINIPC